MENPNMAESTKTGLVAFFDILGYQNLLERNEPEVIAEEVLPILIGMKGKIRVSVFTSFVKNLDSESKNLSNEDRENIIKAIAATLLSMDWVVFSDTIVLTLPINQEAIHEQRLLPWMIFFSAASLIQNELFDAGLPSRGAVDYGKFFVRDSCFAGRTIVNAYKLCNQIELSACILSKLVANEMDSMLSLSGRRKQFFENYLVEYLVPLKDGERHFLVLKSIPSSIKDDVLTTVLSAFWGRGKDIPKEAQSKVVNTQQWLEFLKNH